MQQLVIPCIVLGVALAMMICEAAVPGRNWPRVPGWWLRAIGMNLVQVGAVYLAGLCWDPWLRDLRLWNADSLGTTGGAALGYLIITFIYYWWHRVRHSSPLLWRWLHQLHHSPQRIEVITSFYKHPLEIVVNSVLSSAILYCVAGVGPVAAGQAILVTGLAELVYHWNVRTPHWLGYIFQRPESHCVHHQDGLHAFNYADLPLWDMCFGTFRNPRDWQARCGFSTDAEARIGAMLAGRDLSAPRGPA